AGDNHSKLTLPCFHFRILNLEVVLKWPKRFTISCGKPTLYVPKKMVQLYYILIDISFMKSQAHRLLKDFDWRIVGSGVKIPSSQLLITILQQHLALRRLKIQSLACKLIH